jgi:catechol 2,3-dioxygenase-like lactoylglutathione lyase family enzyme
VIVAFDLVTPDPDRLAAFYVRALGCARQGVWLHLGAQPIRLVAAAAEARPYPADSTAADRWFQHFAIVTSDIAVACAGALSAGAVAMTQGGPQHLPARAGGVLAWKFRDPDGHPLELLQFPPDAIPPAWRDTHGLHLGIDHSAISVGDVDASIDYYVRRFGFAVASRQINQGVEQSRLDGLADARAEVVALHPPGHATPHLELLGYRPRGRASLFGPGDVAATCIVLAANDDGGAPDPDGHWMRWTSG